jgi:formate dehydrogenase alpha subunit
LSKIKIDKVEINFDGSPTIMDLAWRNGIKIPGLCYDYRLKPYGACRLCQVEIKGLSGLHLACNTLAKDDMEVITKNDEINEIRKIILDLLLSDHPLDCMICDATGECELQNLAYEYGIKSTRFSGGSHNWQMELSSSLIAKDQNKCILCGRCVRICSEVVKATAINFADKGFDTVIDAGFGETLNSGTCVFCGNCISTCPVGALFPKSRIGRGRTWELKSTRTTCIYCGVGCQLILKTKGQELIDVVTNVYKPPNYGSLCVKGKFGMDFINHPDRLKMPLIKKDGTFVESNWEDALNLVVNKFKELLLKYGPNKFAGFSSAKCTNEENYLFQKFVRAVMKTNNVDHCARLCHASTIAGLAMAFGSGAMTNSIEDVLESDVILIIGSNTYEAHPVIAYKILEAVSDRGAKLIVIDPRKIFMTNYADIWLAHKPGSDVAVLNGIMNMIISEGLQDDDFILSRTEGYEVMKENVSKYDLGYVEGISGVPANDLIKAARLYGSAKNASIFYSMGITQHSTGTDNVLSLANLAMLTGNIGRKGTGINPLRGQNNVQGSCDVGALPNLYPGYQSVNDPTIREKMEKAWGTSLPTNAGLTLVEIINAASSGEIKYMYIMGENPAMSDPDLNHVLHALENLEFVVVQDIFLSETARMADVVLPGTSFAEKDGTFTNTERRVQRIRQAIEPIGNSRPDWKIICDISTRMGYDMAYSSTSEIMDEIAALTPIYGGISYSRIEDEGLQWPCPDKDHPGTPILHTYQFTRGKGKFHVVEYIPPAEQPDEEYQFILTTGRLLHHFHTGTLTRRIAGINEIVPFGKVEINPSDAREIGIQKEDEVVLESRRGKITARVEITDKVKPGVVFMPFHFYESAANVLTNAALDPIAKIPEYKVCALKVYKYSD